MELENKYRYFIGGYYGVAIIDEYLLKEYILKDIENYIKEFVETNSMDELECQKIKEEIKNNTSEKEKLQDALLLLNDIKGPMDLVFLIKGRLKRYSKKNCYEGKD